MQRSVAVGGRVTAVTWMSLRDCFGVVIFGMFELTRVSFWVRLDLVAECMAKLP